MNLLVNNTAYNMQNDSFNDIGKRINNTAVLTTSNPLKFNSGLNSDTFIKTSPHFTSANRSANSTKRGRFLKKLNDITDPYSGAKILTKEEYEIFQQTIPQIEDPHLRLQQMMKYTRNMRPVEKQAYLLLDKNIRNAKKAQLKNENDSKLTFGEILKSEKPKALKRLEEKEYNILDKVELETLTMKPHNAAMVLEEVEKARNTVSSEEHRFKRKDFIQSLTNMREEQKDNPHFEYLVGIAHRLPNSHTDLDAFIVKYANRSDREITERLVSSSVGTIEHIIPDTFDGENEAANFLLTTAGSNVERDTLGFKDYLKIHPKIPKYCQEYMNNIIDAGNNGKLDGYEWYPYVVAPTIKEEMGLEVDLSKYKIKPKKAFKTLPERLWDMYPQYNQYFNKKDA